MVRPRRLLFLLLPLFVAACQSPLLPSADNAKQIPPSFLFRYEYVRTVTDQPSPVAAPAPTGKDEATKSANSRGAKPAAEEEQVGHGLPAHFWFSVPASGVVTYEAEFLDPKSSPTKGQVQIDDATLQKIYDLVRQANVEQYADPGIFTGNDPSLGKETYTIVGDGNRQVLIDVQGTRVKELAALWNAVLALLPAKRILSPASTKSAGFVLDRRTGMFHRASCPLVKEIPPADRVYLSSAWAALNMKGQPCPKCDPLGTEKH